MWYRFSKPKWRYDIIDGIEEIYAYTKADSQEEAIKKVNNRDSEGRIYAPHTCDLIEKVLYIPEEDHKKVVY